MCKFIHLCAGVEIMCKAINLDWVVIKPSTGEEHISLNPHKNKEIKEFILNILKIDPKPLE